MTFIAKSEASVFYEASYSNDNSLFLSINNTKFFITDGRYTEEASQQVSNCAVVNARDIVKKAGEILKQNKVKKVFIDPSEWHIDEFARLEKSLKIAKRVGLLTHKRARKSEAELKKLKLAAEIGAKAFDEFAFYLRDDGAGKDEFELNWKAREIFSEFGRRELSFEPIVAIDANSSLPHAKPTSNKLKKDSIILVDAGVKYEGYCSDRTRTASFSDSLNFSYNQKFKSTELQKVYDVVLKAHDEAIKLARPGMMACEVDKIARDVIMDAGFGEHFVHSLGHGVGIEIHEYPAVGARSKDVVTEGMVFTVEPGIYLPGVGGVRIEDMVLMKSDGVEVL